MIRIRFSLIVFNLTIGVSSLAQSFGYKLLTVADGLPQSQVSCLAEDRFGYLWIGTEGGGIAKCDGKEFKIYNLEDGLIDDYIYDLVFDKNGMLWISTRHGLSKFDGKKFKTIVNDAVLRVAPLGDSILINNQDLGIRVIYKDSIINQNWHPIKGETVRAIFRHSNKKVYLFTNTKSIHVLNSDDKSKPLLIGNLEIRRRLFSSNGLLVSTNQGIYKLDDKEIKQVSSYDGPAAFIDEETNTLWKREANKLIRQSMIDGKTLTISDVESISSTIKDQEGNYWFGTTGRGLLYVYKNDFTKQWPQLINDAVFQMYEQPDETLWVGTKSKGLLIFKEGKLIKTFDFHGGQSARVSKIIRDWNGNIWVSTFGGLAKFIGTNQVAWFDKGNGMPSTFVFDMDVDLVNRKLWLSMPNTGVASFDGVKEWKLYTDSSGVNVSYGIHYQPEDQTVYFGRNKGIGIVRNGTQSTIDLKEIRDLTIYTITSFRSSGLLIGSAGKGIFLYDLKSDSLYKFSRKQGLSSSYTFFLAADRNEFIWAGGERGIDRIKLTKNFSIEERRNFSVNNGLSGVETCFGAYLFGENDNYFGLVDGLYKLDLEPTFKDFEWPLHFTSISFGQNLLTDSITWNRNESSVSFSFDKVNKKNPTATQYKYKLVGQSDDWISTDKSKTIQFNNLAPGNYKIVVAATDSKGNWNETVSQKFAIKPSFFRSPEGLGIMGGLTLASLAVVFYIRSTVRKKSQEDRDRLREEIGRDFHDEMGNHLVRIIHYTGMMRQLNGNMNEYISGIEASTKTLFDGTKDFLWALNPANETVFQLFIHLRDFGDRLYSNSPFDFRAFYEIKQSWAMPPGYHRQCNLILKEAMTNVFKHSTGNAVELHFCCAGKYVEFYLFDNGKERWVNKAENAEGRGLPNMRFRAQTLGVQLSFDDREGSIVKISFPIKSLIKKNEQSEEKSLDY